MLVPRLTLHALLVIWIMAVGIAYATGTSPAFALVGIIMTTCAILVYRAIAQAKQQ